MFVVKEYPQLRISIGVTSPPAPELSGTPGGVLSR
jgi:hypothetical protein